MGFDMSLKRVGVSEPLLTEGTRIWVGIFMDSAMTLKVSVISELGTTVLAVIRLLPRMKHSVRFKTLKVIELLTTDITKVIAFFEAAPLVALQSVLLSERLATLFTRETLYVRVDDRVFLDIGRLIRSEGTSRMGAREALNLIMHCSHVISKLADYREFLERGTSSAFVHFSRVDAAVSGQLPQACILQATHVTRVEHFCIMELNVSFVSVLLAKLPATFRANNPLLPLCSAKFPASSCTATVLTSSITWKYAYNYCQAQKRQCLTFEK